MNILGKFYLKDGIYFNFLPCDILNELHLPWSSKGRHPKKPQFSYPVFPIFTIWPGASRVKVCYPEIQYCRNISFLFGRKCALNPQHPSFFSTGAIFLFGKAGQNAKFSVFVEHSMEKPKLGFFIVPKNAKFSKKSMFNVDILYIQLNPAITYICLWSSVVYSNATDRFYFNAILLKFSEKLQFLKNHLIF